MRDNYKNIKYRGSQKEPTCLVSNYITVVRKTEIFSCAAVRVGKGCVAGVCSTTAGNFDSFIAVC